MNCVVVDYGTGNLFSVQAALRCAGFKTVTDSDGSMIPQAEFAVLPGVASFGEGLQGLRRASQLELLREHVNEGKHLFGICLGAQILLELSDESPGQKGLAVIPGRVLRNRSPSLRTPNHGWMQLMPNPDVEISSRPLFPAPSTMYFSHSFAMYPNEPRACAAYAMSNGEAAFCAAVTRGNVLGVQFHPEKSGNDGLSFLRRVRDWAQRTI